MSSSSRSNNKPQASLPDFEPLPPTSTLNRIINKLLAPLFYLLFSIITAIVVVPIYTIIENFKHGRNAKGGQRVARNERPSRSGQQQNNKVSQAWIIGTQTILPGAPAQVISGTTYSLASDSASIFMNNVAHNVYSGTNGNSDNVPYVLPGSNTVQPGGSAVTVSGTTYSLSPHGSTLYINGIATILPPSPSNPPFIIDGHTISPGSQATVIDGQTYSVAAATAGGALYVNGTKIADPQNFALLSEAMAALESVVAASTTASPSSSFDGMLTLASSTASGSGPSPTNTSHSGAVRLVTKSDGWVALVAAVLLGGGMVLGSLL